MRKLLLGTLSSVMLSLQMTAGAAVITTVQAVDFQLPTTSFWGPSGNVLSFGTSAMLGSDALGISYAARASSGSVSGSMSGVMRTTYQDTAMVGQNWDAAFAYNSNPGGGGLGTFLGASIDVIAHALGGDICIYCAGRSLSVDMDFTPSLGQNARGSDTESAAQPGIGVNFGVGSVSAGVDLAVRQEVLFQPLGIAGLMRATQAATGQSMSFVMDFGLEGEVERPSFRPTSTGVWNIQVENLLLRNRFDTDFALDINPFVQFTIGFGCGSPGSNRDNGWFCIADDRATFNLANVGLYNGTPFALPFSEVDLPSFQITVVPTPSTLSLMLAVGVVGAARLARRARRAGTAAQSS